MHRPSEIKLTINDFFGWKFHPFADTYNQRQRFMPNKDMKYLESIKRLLHTGKSVALLGPSGSGKTTFVHTLIQDLDKNTYRPVLIPYAGHPRNGFTRVLAETIGVDIKTRGLPLIARVQQHIETMLTGSNPHHPVIIIDDAQRVEADSLWDLCSLLFQTAKQTVASSLILAGDESLAKRLELYAMAPIRARLTTVMKLAPLTEQESLLFVETRLKNAAAPSDLFEIDALSIISAHARGNRRLLMNFATLAIEDAYYRQDKTITAESIYASEWFNESE
jgi:type II secretory pathway predicted ATPase ExeA